MLNLNCVICAELFTSSDDVHVTTCGHMFHVACLNQWLQRSKTCPQCRNKCNDRNIFRLYFNLANLDVSRIDVGSLQEQLDNANLQLKMKENQVNKAEDQIKSLKATQKKCTQTITNMEKQLKKNDFVVLSYSEQIKLLKNEIKVVEDLRKQIKDLKFQLEIMEGVSTILSGSAADTEKLISNENDPKVLGTWVTALKRELRLCEHKKTDIRNMLKVAQADLRKETERRKKHEEKISYLESENYQLQEKIKILESTKETNKASVTTSSEIINVPIFSLQREEKRQTISPTIKENIKKIEDSNSPYLNIKSSSLGLVPLFKRNHEPSTIDLTTKTTTTKLATLKISPIKSSSALSNGALRKTSSDLSDKYSIFKKPRLGMASAAASAGTASLMKPLGPNFVFNGFGGSEKVDPFANNLDEDEEIEIENQRRLRKLPNPISAKTSSITYSLNNRLKAGGLRNFKVSK